MNGRNHSRDGRVIVGANPRERDNVGTWSYWTKGHTWQEAPACDGRE